MNSEKIFNQLIELKKNNLNKEFDLLLDDLINSNLKYFTDYSLDLALFLFENSEYQKALIFFKLYLENYADEEIFQAIIDSYYIPNKEQYLKNYKKNCEALNNYEFYFGKKLDLDEELTCLPLWNDEKYLFFLDLNKKNIISYKKEIIEHLPKNYQEKNYEPIFVFNDIDFKTTLKLENFSFEKFLKDDIGYKATKYRNFIYCIFDKEVFRVVLNIKDFKELFIRERIFIYQSINDFKSDKNLILKIISSKIIFSSYSNVRYHYKILNDIKKCLQNVINYISETENKLELYYKTNKDLIINNIINKNPKIFLMTSKFTTIIQYHIKYLQIALENLNIRTYLFYMDEKNNSTEIDLLNAIVDFKPDIVINCNYFRNSILPKELVFLTWLQDIADLDKLKNNIKLNQNDFILNHFISDKNLLSSKTLDFNKFIDAPICSSEDIYKKYNITKEEKEKYSCDICIIAHNCDVNSFIENIESEFIKTIFKQLLKIISSSKNLYLSINDFNDYIDEFYEEINSNLKQEEYEKIQEIIENEINIIKNQYISSFNYRLIKLQIVNTLLDAGFTNIKLWGREWSNIEKFKPYAMGIAENGETLSKILQCSKIVLGCHHNSSVQSRIFETFLSGSFFMNSYVEPDEDISDVRRFFKEDEELIFFRDKKDLIKKVKYYLENDEERNKMIKIGREISLKEMTYKGLSKRFLNYLSNYYTTT